MIDIKEKFLSLKMENKLSRKSSRISEICPITWYEGLIYKFS